MPDGIIEASSIECSEFEQGHLLARTVRTFFCTEELCQTEAEELHTDAPRRSCKAAAAAIIAAGCLMAFAAACFCWHSSRGRVTAVTPVRTLSRGISLSTTLPDITFITVETRGAPLIAHGGRFEDQFDTRILNLGIGKKWEGFRTKVDLLAKYLRGQVSLEGYKAPGEVEQDLAVFFDGGDVLWGGCDPESFRGAYEQIVAASGASIVFSAEIVCGEQDCNKVPEVPQWAEELSGKNLSAGFWKPYAVGCNSTWTDECSARRDCGYWAPCAVPPRVKFLNSGFLMGPVKALAEMLQWCVSHYQKYSVWGDQSVFAMYWLANPTKVTLDYAGVLAISLSDLDYKVLDVRSDTLVLRNNAFDRVQCLVHGNGRGRTFIKQMLDSKEHKTLQEVRGY